MLQKNQSTRNPYYDVLKGLLIIFVIVGHGFQFGNGANFAATADFMDYKVVQFIYSFHMPLFAIICGMFFYFSAQKYTLIHNLADKFRQFLMPIALLSLFYYIVFPNENIYNSIYSAAGGLWFLLSMFYSVIIVMIMSKLCRTIISESVFIVILTVLLYFIKNDFCLSIHKFMIIFFIIGYIASKYGIVNSTVNIWKNKKTIFIIGGGFYAIYLIIPFYFVLYGGFGYGKQSLCWGLTSVICRIITSTLFVIVIMNIVKCIYSKTEESPIWHIINITGRYTMGIYVFQTIIYGIIKNIHVFISNNMIINSICVSIIVFMLSFVLTYICSYNKFLRYFLIGMKWKS